MIAIHPLTRLDKTDLAPIMTTYVSEGIYAVSYRDSPTDTSIDLHYVTLPEPAVRSYDHIDAATLQRYTQLFTAGFSFGAYDGELLVGLIIAEPQEWNRSLSSLGVPRRANSSPRRYWSATDGAGRGTSTTFGPADDRLRDTEHKRGGDYGLS